jgi:hypothetical protein
MDIPLSLCMDGRRKEGRNAFFIEEDCDRIESGRGASKKRGGDVAYDEGMEARIDEILEGLGRYDKKNMFGGVCYLKSGNMAFGIWKDHLIVRCGSGHYEKCLRAKHTRKFDVTGRTMSGWIMVAPEGIEEDRDLEKWIRTGDKYVSTLPPKRPK